MRKTKLAFILISSLIAFIPLDIWFSEFMGLSNLIFDYLHFPFFLLLTYQAIKLTEEIAYSKIKVLFGIFIFILLIETIQFFIGRTASFFDVIFGIAGSVCGYAISKAYRVLAIVFVLLYLIPLTTNLYLLWLAKVDLPILNDFERSFSHKVVGNLREIKNIPLEREWNEDKNSYVVKGYKMDISWSGITFIYPLRLNIVDYIGVEFDFYSKTNSLILDVRIEGGGDSKIVSSKPLRMGWNKVFVRLRDANEFNAINKLSIYYASKIGPDWYLIDNIALKK